MNGAARGLGAIAMLALAGAGASTAQVVTIRAREAASNRPTVGSLVSLREPAGRVVARALTDQSGTVRIQAPASGSYFVRVDRIGFQGVTLGPVHLAAGDTVRLDARMPGDRIILPDLTVTTAATAACELEASAGEVVSLLWEEARKVLAGAEATADQLPALEVTRFEREFDVGTDIRAESRSRGLAATSRPFVAADPAKLAKNGFEERANGGSTFYAPDARVLLSDEFLGQHCFRAVRSEADTALVGLAFAPIPALRRRTDVEGTLWIDRTRAELQSLDFRYTNVAKRIASGHDGGRIEFVRLAGGEWIVGRWKLRVGRFERGGEVAMLDGSPAADSAWVVGVVFDSIASQPLAGVAVRTRAGASAVTDSIGRYRLAVPVDAITTVEVADPRLAPIEARTTMELTPRVRGQEITADFTSPSAATLIGRHCHRRLDPASETVVTGLLVDGEGRGVPGDVTIRWTRSGVLRAGQRIFLSGNEAGLTVTADSTGRFRGCGVPVGQELRVWATNPAELQRIRVAPGQGGSARITRR